MSENFVLEGQMNRKPWFGFSHARTEWEFAKIILTAETDTRISYTIEEFEQMLEEEEVQKAIEESQIEGTEDGKKKGAKKKMFTDLSSFDVGADDGKFSVILTLNPNISLGDQQGLKFQMFKTKMERHLERHFGLAVSDDQYEKISSGLSEKGIALPKFITKFERQDDKK